MYISRGVKKLVASLRRTSSPYSITRNYLYRYHWKGNEKYQPAFAVALPPLSEIPARYVNGYLRDIGVPFDPAPMDFNAWFEAYLDGAWHTWDARHNEPRIGRIPIARGRDACDVPMLQTFGPHQLKSFAVVTEKVGEAQVAA